MRGQTHVPVAQSIELGAKREYRLGTCWCRDAIVDGVKYVVGIERGKPVRIPYKPRGQNRGWKYNGFVRNGRGIDVWAGNVGGSLGAKGLLIRAGVVSPLTP